MTNDILNQNQSGSCGTKLDSSCGTSRNKGMDAVKTGQKKDDDKNKIKEGSETTGAGFPNSVSRSPGRGADE